MEEKQRVYSHEMEFKCLNISLGSEEVESNGRRSIVEPIKFVDTMRSLSTKVGR